jgi:hypothetical protein
MHRVATQDRFPIRSECAGAPSRQSFLGRVPLRGGVDAEFLANMGEFFWVGETAIRHHRAEHR